MDEMDEQVPDICDMAARHGKSTPSRRKRCQVIDTIPDIAPTRSFELHSHEIDVQERAIRTLQVYIDEATIRDGNEGPKVWPSANTWGSVAS